MSQIVEDATDIISKRLSEFAARAMREKCAWADATDVYEAIPMGDVMAVRYYSQRDGKESFDILATEYEISSNTAVVNVFPRMLKIIERLHFR